MWPNTKAHLYGKDAGTVIRFLLPSCAISEGRYHISASAQMSARPVAGLIDALLEQGVEFEFYERSHALPLTLKGHGLRGGDVKVPGNQSSQFLSGLMMAAPYAQNTDVA